MAPNDEIHRTTGETHTWWWLSSNAMTLAVKVNRQAIIIQAPPIAQKFVGQHFNNLTNWMGKQRGFKMRKYS